MILRYEQLNENKMWYVVIGIDKRSRLSREEIKNLIS